jgi:XapX domain-containing protein
MLSAELGRKLLGVVAAFTIGFIVRKLDIPSPAPMTLFGCGLVLAMTVGYLLGK